MSDRSDNNMFGDLVERAEAERAARARAARAAASQPSRKPGTIGPAPSSRGSALGDARRGPGRVIIMGVLVFAVLTIYNAVFSDIETDRPDERDRAERIPVLIPVPGPDTSDIDVPEELLIEIPPTGASRPPELIAEFPFRYPVDIMDVAVEGSARLEFYVDAGGRVQDLVIRELSDPAFDAAIRRAMSTRLYKPAQSGGEAVRSELMAEDYSITPTNIDRLRIEARLRREVATNGTRQQDRASTPPTDAPADAPTSDYTPATFTQPFDLPYEPEGTIPHIQFVAVGYIVSAEGRISDFVHLAGTRDNAFKIELALSKLRFRPATRKGQAVESEPQVLEHVFMPTGEQLALINARRVDRDMEPRAPFFEEPALTGRARGRYSLPWDRDRSIPIPSFPGRVDLAAHGNPPRGDEPRRAVHAPLPVLPSGTMGPVSCRVVFAVDTLGQVKIDSVSAHCPSDDLSAVMERQLRSWRYDPVTVANRRAPSRFVLRDVGFAPG